MYRSASCASFTLTLVYLFSWHIKSRWLKHLYGEYLRDSLLNLSNRSTLNQVDDMSARSARPCIRLSSFMHLVSSICNKYADRTYSFHKRAFFSISAVVAGTWLTFRALSPNRGAYIVSNDEEKMMSGKTETMTARAPKSIGDT